MVASLGKHFVGDVNFIRDLIGFKQYNQRCSRLDTELISLSPKLLSSELRYT
jgi:hypothetical protein